MIITQHRTTKIGIPKYFGTRNRIRMVSDQYSRYLWSNWVIFHFSVIFSRCFSVLHILRCTCNIELREMRCPKVSAMATGG